MKSSRTNELAGFTLGAITMRPFAGDNLMAVRADIPKDTVVPAHSHAQEQMTLVVSGRLKMRVADVWREIGAMEIVHVPGGVEHEAVALEDTTLIDIFNPPREDFMAKLAESQNR